MESLTTIHGLLSRTIWMYFLALGLWGLYRAIRGQTVDGGYLGASAIGQLLFVAQAVMGIILWIGGQAGSIQRASIHFLYGFFALVFLPFIFLVTLRGDDTNRAQWVLAFTTLVLFVIALRSISTSI